MTCPNDKKSGEAPFVDQYDRFDHRWAFVGADAAPFAMVVIDAGDLPVFQDKAGVGARNPAVQTLDAQIQIEDRPGAPASPKAGRAGRSAAGIL
jgi:hypothetical protein